MASAPPIRCVRLESLTYEPENRLTAGRWRAQCEKADNRSMQQLTPARKGPDMVSDIRWLPLVLLAVGVVFTAGCSMEPAINVTYKWNLKPGELKWYVEESDPGGQRKVNVSMKPHPSDANVMVAL